MKSLLESIKTTFQSKELNGKSLDHWKTTSTEEILDIKDDIEHWKATLSDQEYQVLREKGTEAAHSSLYNRHMPKQGHYACRACGNPLFSYQHKFESGCGWPAFGKFVPDSIQTRDDYSLQMKRTEIVCNQCQSHLGHAFTENNTNGDSNYTERHCVNGISIRYVNKGLSKEADNV